MVYREKRKMSEQPTEEELIGMKPDSDEDTQTCERCSHYQVCFTRKNIHEFLEQHFKSESPIGRKEKPFNSSNLAKICNFYEPQMRIVVER